MLISIGLIIFLAGCVKEKPTELQFKNDIATIENYFVSNVAPYEKGKGEATPTSIQFELHNNGDQKIPYLEVDFFDIPGFEIVSNSLKCEPIGNVIGNKCIFSDNNALEPLDVRSITIQLKSTEDVSSPTPHTISFAVRYTYFGFREVSIPVIDGQTRKQPLTKFRQSEPSFGPVVLDIDPAIEREIAVGDKTIKENWAVGGDTPLPFSTKFKFKHVGSVLGKIKDVNISVSSVRLNILGLKTEDLCDFCERGSVWCQDKLKKFGLDVGKIITENKYSVDLGEKYFLLPLLDAQNYSIKSVLVPFDTLICTFKPNIFQPEYSASISAFFAYKYEFIKSQDFVIQPLPE